MSPYIFSTLLMSLGLGTTLTFSSSHWFLAWMGLEINTLAIIPLMARPHHPRATEAALKYFITQATAAAMILFAATMNAWFQGQWEISQMTHPVASAILTMALALKLGLAPVHFWLPEVLQGVSLGTGLVLSTWQKLAPFALILQVSNNANPYLLMALAVSSTLVGGWAGLNQTQLRKILAYSSIAHLGWMILIIQLAPQMTIIALSTYIVMTTAAFLTLMFMNVTKINTLVMGWVKAPALAALTCLSLLSLGGLPPLTGFLPKWLILQEMSTQGFLIAATIVALTALLSLFFYLRLSYAVALTYSPHVNYSTPSWRIQVKQSALPLAVTVTLALCLLPISPTILAFFS
uniref:NADH-ubiquinone oxidoreductase chain 2 n=1 Tax=Etrumeus micropus TaxID=942859 RepID=A5PIG1_9TELE|nr:NADH dehydrogenase subunit 2 [Etrumeus teres]BAF64050.1 NADH dehydrogenase subunit 2 [Etrumeus micropus]